MTQRYLVGQKVIIKPVQSPSSSTRDCGIEPYVGQIGEVTDYHWILPPAGQVVYTYTVRVGAEPKEIVLHEDEIESLLE